MADIVNLRQARKHRARTQKERVAEQNRAAFGRPKAEREHERGRADQARRFIDGHRREASPEPRDE